jgi:poly(3-hydroxybutyrate) depolymerase
VYPGFLQYAGFVAMNPNNHANSHYDYFQNLIKGDSSSTESHRQFYDEYNAVLDMDANYYLQTIRVVFQDFSLPTGTWDIRSVDGTMERVRPSDIKTTALLSIEGELDDISGSGQTKAVHEICSGVPESLQQHIDVEGAGHYGIFSGRRWREKVYPQVRAFVLQQNASLKKAAAPVPAKPEVVAAPVVEPEPVVIAPVAESAEAVVEPIAVVPAVEPVEPVEPVVVEPAAAPRKPVHTPQAHKTGSKKQK